MPPKKQEITLVVESHDLPSLELRQRRKSGLKQTSNSVTKSRNEAIQDEFRMVWCCACVSLRKIQGQIYRGK